MLIAKLIRHSHFDRNSHHDIKLLVLQFSFGFYVIFDFIHNVFKITLTHIHISLSYKTLSLIHFQFFLFEFFFLLQYQIWYLLTWCLLKLVKNAAPKRRRYKLEVDMTVMAKPIKYKQLTFDEMMIKRKRKIANKENWKNECIVID